MTARAWLEDHDRELRHAMAALHRDAPVIDDWAYRLTAVLTGGGRLLAAGNGGSAAEAQHLTAELVGRFLDERQPLSAICLSAETSSLTAIVNDYGVEEMFARQVQAHGRPGDVLVLLSTSGRSPNVLHAADRARRCGLLTWAMTGPGPNPLTARCDDALIVEAPSTAAVQAVHLVAIHVLCAAVDTALARSSHRPTTDSAARSGRRVPLRIPALPVPAGRNGASSLIGAQQSLVGGAELTG
jgi:D-sedoheptulose 7-phosphate isomerase